MNATTTQPNPIPPPRGRHPPPAPPDPRRRTGPADPRTAAATPQPPPHRSRSRPQPHRRSRPAAARAAAARHAAGAATAADGDAAARTHPAPAAAAARCRSTPPALPPLTFRPQRPAPAPPRRWPGVAPQNPFGSAAGLVAQSGTASRPGGSCVARLRPVDPGFAGQKDATLGYVSGAQSDRRLDGRAAALGQARLYYPEQASPTTSRASVLLLTIDRSGRVLIVQLLQLRPLAVPGRGLDRRVPRLDRAAVHARHDGGQHPGDIHPALPPGVTLARNADGPATARCGGEAVATGLG